jgi:hypothetical protein
MVTSLEVMSVVLHHHHQQQQHLQELSLLARSVLKNETIFFAFLDHIFLPVVNIEVA